MDISQIQLGLVRQPVPNQSGVYEMILAWKFYGSGKVVQKNGTETDTGLSFNGPACYLTINAQDGSIICRSGRYTWTWKRPATAL